ncbi:transglycosylase SLT domain-containing protein [Bradymonas sediminis]|uniref:transglycosylase SLT domain-containing protein n=1 Tax=Bradymonas sediminis TaxID=1548548 RepID=UPI00105ED2D6|nr:transglycosylase SLT domain-containing protein [Bradymonas sediminis]TDP71964.1 tetratricopeptide repeat protein [Bradymonas sediminis]
MREQPNIWTKTLFSVKAWGVVGFSAVALWAVPDLSAERFGVGARGTVQSPLNAAALESVQTQLRVPAVVALAGLALQDAQGAAQLKSVEVGEEQALSSAQQAFFEERIADAEQILAALIPHRQAQLKDESLDDATRDRLQTELYQAQLLHAHSLSRLDKHAAAADVFAQLEGKTGVDDFVYWLRGQALRRAGKPAEAAKAMQAAFDQDTTPVKLRAQVGNAHALVEAKDWKSALPVLEQVIDALPNYPRRYKILYYRAQALEQLGRLDEAARAYQQAWFEFPHKEQGAMAREDLARLAKSGHEPAPISRTRLFERYRMLRINKHWDLAEELFLELMEEHKTPGGHSAFEHEILTQLVLNSYVPDRNKEAMGWLQKLKAEYEAGHTAGISADLLYSYLSHTYSRLGDFEKSRAALETKLANASKNARATEIAQFLKDHGRYQEAKEIYDELYTSWRKLGWDYTWLLYKTGDFQQAYENLTRLAERSSGQKRAKYMYWAARTLTLDGNIEEATKLYTDIARVYELGYYGIQAHNRLLDIQQGKAVDDRLIAQTRGIVDGASEVLAAMEQVEDGLESSVVSAANAYQDPRTVQRTGKKRAAQAKPGEAVADRSSEIDCSRETGQERHFCEMLVAQSRDAKHTILESALAPYLPYTNLMSSSVSGISRAEIASAVLDGDTEIDAIELGDSAGEDAPPPRRGVAVSKHRSTSARANFDTPARIYWEGRRDSPAAFVNADNGKAIGPMPSRPIAYDEDAYQGGLERAIAEMGDLFPQLERARWLRDAGYSIYARWVIRDFAMEYIGLRDAGRPGAKPIELSTPRWTYLIDNRRRDRAGMWGFRSDEPRYPVPGPAAERKAMLERQQEIYDRRNQIAPLALDALKDVGDFHMVRSLNFGTGPWYRADPKGPLRYKWMQAYPRAFPRQVIRESKRNGINPYLVWAVMTVESTYNPDSISYADALGLLQVIPRTGIKTAEMLGDETFGAEDLLTEDVAVQHGAFYLGKLVKKFRGQEFLAIAGYNGGPHRVSAWMDKRGRDMPLDEFVEEIPFDQARGYTKKVTRFLALYLRIYEGVEHLYVGQNMNLDYLPDPNF